MIIIMVKFRLLDLDIPHGNNLMTIGPPMIGKSILARNLFLEKLNEDYNGIYITTRDLGSKRISISKFLIV